MKIFILSIFERPFCTGFTVFHMQVRLVNCHKPVSHISVDHGLLNQESLLASFKNANITLS